MYITLLDTDCIENVIDMLESHVTPSTVRSIIPDAVSYAAFVRGEIIAVILCSLNTSIHIHYIYVKPQYRNHHIATQLIEQVTLLRDHLRRRNGHNLSVLYADDDFFPDGAKLSLSSQYFNIVGRTSHHILYALK